MTTPLRFSYTQRNQSAGATGYAPLLPLLLEKNGHTQNVSALLDTGASVNVLPYTIGVQLGLVWENETGTVQLSGNLSSVPTKIILVTETVSGFPPVRLAFTWAQTDNVPLILGQVNFFMEFDVCFFRSQLAFEVFPKSTIASP